MPLAGGHSDDISLLEDPAQGWGWLAQKGFDIIQTDWAMHCVNYLRENNLFSSRKLSIGFCPICSKPVCELVEWRFDGIMHKTSVSGIKANDLMIKHKDEIVYSLREYNYSKIKSKPFGWIFGINKSVKSGNGEKIKQYASDFYGNKELIKSF